MTARGGQRRPIALAATGMVLLLGVGAACASPRASLGNCVRVPNDVLRQIEGRLSVDGELRNGRMVASPDNDYAFVSAELREAEVDEGDGDILTWATKDTARGEFVSVDVHARELSRWPHATFDVRTAGAISSRACTSEDVGKVSAGKSRA